MVANPVIGKDRGSDTLWTNKKRKEEWHGVPTQLTKNPRRLKLKISSGGKNGPQEAEHKRTWPKEIFK